MITRAERLKLFKRFARERDCAVCKDWPRREKVWRRLEIDDLPKGICVRCNWAFWHGFIVWTKDEVEMDELTEAIREDRRKGTPRPNGHELLKQLR
jgi:hypothetical protein